MAEKISDLEITKIYSKMKQFFIDGNYQIIIDNPSVQLSIKQGSIWGILPRTAKKIINYTFKPTKTGTRIKFFSSFAAEWKKLTIIGYLFSIIFFVLSLWISIDLQNIIHTGNASFWSWILTSSNIVSSSLAQSFSDLTRILAIFLILVLFVETFIVFYSHIKINDIAKEILAKFDRET